MTQNRLADLLEHPDVQQKILHGYQGGYSLGLTSHPSQEGKLAIRVRIEGEDASLIPRQIVLDGETIPIVVNTSFEVPGLLK
jgi:hypothetical protein